MRELLVLLVVAPFALLVVFTHQLQIAQPVVIAPLPTLTVSMPIPTPAAFIGPPSNIVEAAMQWLGTPYLWGGCTRRGVDCSCFVRNVLLVFGINAPRTTVEQIKWATPVTREALQVGDLVFFNNTCTNCGANPTHVALAIGNGMMIHAGDPVHIETYETSYWREHYAGAGRVPSA